MKTYSSTRWSKWEVIHQLLIQFGDIQPFVCASDLESKSKQKLVTFLQDFNKKSLLMVEITSIVDWGEPFVKGTYKLEGDGALAFCTYEVVLSIVVAIQVDNAPNVTAVIRSLTLDQSIQAQLTQYSKNCIQPALDYFNKQISTSLSHSLMAFKAARLFCPPTASDVESLSLFPFISQETIAMLQKEPSYLAKAEGTAPDVDYLHWWKNNADSLPIWASCAKKILSVQPSSSAAESFLHNQCFFSRSTR